MESATRLAIQSVGILQMMDLAEPARMGKQYENSGSESCRTDMPIFRLRSRLKLERHWCGSRMTSWGWFLVLQLHTTSSISDRCTKDRRRVIQGCVQRNENALKPGDHRAGQHYWLRSDAWEQRDGDTVSATSIGWGRSFSLQACPGPIIALRYRNSTDDRQTL